MGCVGPLGHTAAATWQAIELVAAVGAIGDAVVPPTLHVGEQDPACDLDVVPHVARHREVRAALSNSFAFGGTNAVIAVGAWRA
jgi:nodulation protein E